jgi:hypothetical protein
MSAQRRLRRIPIPVIGFAALWLVFSGIFLLLSVDEYYAARYRVERVDAQRLAMHKQLESKGSANRTELRELHTSAAKLDRIAAAVHQVEDDAAGTMRLWVILMVVPIVLGGASWVAYSLAAPDRGVDMSWD